MENPIIDFRGLNLIGTGDLQALADCIKLYLSGVPSDYRFIDDAGYNFSNGYTWLYLANGIEIVAGFGSCYFQVFDSETGEEHTADTWSEIIEIQNELNARQDD